MTKHKQKSSKSKLPKSHSKNFGRQSKSKRSHSKVNIFGCKSKTKQNKMKGKHPKAKHAMGNPKANKMKTHKTTKNHPMKKAKSSTSHLTRSKSKGSHLSPSKSKGHMTRSQTSHNQSVRKSVSGLMVKSYVKPGKSQSKINMRTKSGASTTAVPVASATAAAGTTTNADGEKVEIFDGMTQTDENGFNYVYMWKYDDDAPQTDPAFVPSPQEIQEGHGVMPQTSLSAPSADCSHSPATSTPAIAHEVAGASQQWSMNNSPSTASVTVMDGPSMLYYTNPSQSVSMAKQTSKHGVSGETVSFVASPHAPNTGPAPKMGPIIGIPQAGTQKLSAPSSHHTETETSTDSSTTT